MDWKRTFSLRQTDVLGLDIGSSSVKMVSLRKENASYTVTAAAIADIEASGGDNNRRRINTIRSIRECLEFTKVQTKFAICGVCGPQVAVRDFEFPSLPAGEIEGAVLLEAAQACPFNTKDSAVDFQLINTSGDKTSGILVAATKALIKSKVHIVENASLDCIMIDVDGLALLNCFNACEKREAGQPTAILNVGSSYTNLAIIGNHNWPFIRDIAYAGDDIIQQVAEDNDISTVQVREMLSDSSTAAQLDLHDSLDKACLKLTADITKTLRYYTAQEKTSLADKIYVCGGFAMLNEFVEILNSRLAVKTVLWNPFDKIRCNMDKDHRGVRQKNVLKKNGPVMVVAAGLAMRSI